MQRGELLFVAAEPFRERTAVLPRATSPGHGTGFLALHNELAFYSLLHLCRSRRYSSDGDIVAGKLLCLLGTI